MNTRPTAARMMAVMVLGATVAAGGRGEKREHRAPEPGAAATAVSIWHDPGDAASMDLLYGAGGRAHAPDPAGTYTFIKQDMDGTSPKFDVVDGTGVEWKVKLGPEAKPETAASRFLWAAGYFVDDDYFVAQLTVRNLPPLRRGGEFVSAGGTVHGARLKRRPPGGKRLGNWDWFDNPFAGERELNGLRTMMALLNEWDLKNANNAIYEVEGERRYEVSDLGAGFGRTGWRGEHSKGEPMDYARSPFIGRVAPDSVDFALHARPGFLLFLLDPPYYHEHVKIENVARRVPRADARWLGQRLSMLSEDQIRDGFRAAGYSDGEVEILTRAIRERIAALEAL